MFSILQTRTAFVLVDFKFVSSKVSRTSNYHNQLIRLFRCIKYSNIDAESTTQKDLVLATVCFITATNSKGASLFVNRHKHLQNY